MIETRVIPCLLLQGRGLVKTVQFKKPKYVGDPINAVRIFNDRYVDEIIFLDIAATKEGRGPDFEYISRVTSECFIPFCYGGGISSTSEAGRLFQIGVEKVSLNATAVKDPRVVREMTQEFGSQSIVISIDVCRDWRGRQHVVIHNGGKKTDLDPVAHARNMARLGAGELLVNSVDCDGTMKGYDIQLLKKITAAVDLPIVACGGAGTLEHFAQVIGQTDVSAVAAGSLFVFKGKHRAVLINYPDRSELRSVLNPDLGKDAREEN